MKIHNIPTDETLRSLLAHGCADFPFEYYQDEINQFHNQSIEWHWHKEVEFSLVLKGNVHCFDELNVYHLSPGDGLFLNSGTLHHFESENGGTMVTMVFAPELIAPQESLLYREFIEGIISSDCPLIHFRSSDEKHLPILQNIQMLYDATDRNFLAIRNAASLLWEELLNVTKAYFPQSQSKVDKLLRARIQKMVQYIHQNYQRQIKLSEIADTANISVSEALRCFRASMHTTPINYLNQYRLKCAKRLLLATSDSVISIAMNTGFENPSYFCRAFKKQYGNSPNKYRNTTSYSNNTNGV